MNHRFIEFDDDEGLSRFMDEPLYGTQLKPAAPNPEFSRGYRFIKGKLVILSDTDKPVNLKAKLIELVRRVVK